MIWTENELIEGSGALRFSVTEPRPTVLLATMGGSGVGVLVMTYCSSPISDTLLAGSKATNFSWVSTVMGIGAV